MTFSSNEVATLTEVSLRMLQWFDERDIVSPVHKGHRRVYSLEQTVLIGLIRKLRVRRVGLQRCKSIAKGASPLLRRALKHGTSDTYVATDGIEYIVTASSLVLITHAEHSMKPLYIVNVSEIQRRVEEFDRLRGGIHDQRSC